MTTASSASVLVGVDGSEPNSAVVRWAAHEAAIRGLHLQLVYAGQYLVIPSLSKATAASVSSELDDQVRRALDEAKRIATNAEPQLAVSTEIHRADPIQFLLGQSTTVPLIVLGTHHITNVTGAVLVSISQSVAAHAHCPVVVVNAEQPHNAVPRKAVVVGVSPSQGGKQALRFAFEEAQTRGASLTAVRCWGDIEWGTAVLGSSSPLLLEWERIESEVLDQCLAEVSGDFPAVHVQRRLGSVRASWGLQREALGAELLVVGCHRSEDHWLSRLGPVASWLLHRAPCPLAVVGRPPSATAQPEPAAVGSSAAST